MQAHLKSHWQARSLCWLFCAIACLPCAVTGQVVSPTANDVWAFGDKAGLDFSTGTPVPIQTDMYILEGCASVSDHNGQLLFYSNGTRVWNRDHVLMPHGDSLSGDPNTYPTNSTTQSSLIVPMDGATGKYYLFTLSDANNPDHFGRLVYSIIDMNLDNGLGDVVTDSKSTPIDSFLAEKLIAIQGDHCNIWLLVHAYDSNVFKAYELTAAGISTTAVLSATGGFSPPAYFYGGVMKSSPNRQWIISCSYGGPGPTGSAELFHFNPGTGQVSSFAVLSNNAFNMYYGAGFSADNTKLYITAHQSPAIYQYDLNLGNAAAIVNSAMDITQDAPVAGLAQGDLKLGPDGKLYVAQLYAPAIGVINNPGLQGIACGYTPSQIPLLPNTQSLCGMPNYVIDLQPPLNQTFSETICYFPDSLPLLVASDAWQITWDNGSTDASRFVYEGGTYWVSYYTSPCRYHTDTFMLYAPTRQPHNSFTAPGCKDIQDGHIWSQPAAGDSTTYTYTWKNEAGDIIRTTAHAYTADTLQGLAPGNYTLLLQGAGCDTLFSFSLPSPEYEVAFLVDTLICGGDTVFFQNTSMGSFAHWNWNFGDGVLSSEKEPIHVFAAPGSYLLSLVAQTTTGCIDSARTTIVVDPVANGSLIKDRETLCTGEAVTFITQTDSSVRQMICDFGDGTITTLAPGTVQHAYDLAGTMSVQIQVQFRACPDTIITDIVQVYPFPVAQLTSDSSLCLDTAPLLVQDLIDQPPGYSYSWNTGDTSSAILIKQPGTYQVQVRSDQGCTTTQSITISKDCYIDIPNAFSPNGDGVNDYFFPRTALSKSLAQFQMKVFNRWGALLFESQNVDGRGWDGRFMGKEQPVGVYVYLLEVTFDNGRAESYQGNLTLIR